MKKHNLKIATLLLLAIGIFDGEARAQAVFFNNRLSVQGYLKQGGAGLNGSYNMQFEVILNGSATPIWCQTVSSVAVSSGLFNQALSGNANCVSTIVPMGPAVFASTANTDVYQMTVLVDVGSGLGAGAATFAGIDFVAQPFAMLANIANTATQLATTGVSGQFLKSNGTTWSSQAITAADVSGLGSAATTPSSNYVQVSNNLSDVNASTARTNLGLVTGGTATGNLVTYSTANKLPAADGSNLTNVSASSVGGSTFGAPGAIGGTTPATNIAVSGVITSTQTTGTAPFTVASTTLVTNLNSNFLNGATFAVPGGIGSTTPATSIATSGVIASTVANGTAPFTLTSSTMVAGLNSQYLSGGTWASPLAIGGTLPASGAFTSLTSNAGITDSSATGIKATAGPLTSGTGGTTTGSLVLKSAGGASGVFTINAPAGLSSALAWTLPSAAPGAGQFLQSTDTVGTLAWSAAATGTVTSASVISANGFTGSVANSTTTPAITLTTSVSGVIKGNGTGMSAATSGADYSAGTSALATGIIKSTTTTGALSIATAGTDYLVPAGSAAISTSSGSGITASAGAITSGLSGANAGSLVLMNSAGGGSFTINPASLGAAQTWTLPSTAPAVGNYLMSTNATGTLAWGSPAANSLPLLGGTMSGAIAMGGNNITGGGTITGTTISGTSFASSAGHIDSSATGIKATAGPLTSGTGGTTTGSLVLKSAGGASGVFTINAPAGLSSALAWTLPSAAPGAGQFLQSTDTVGTLAWSAAATGTVTSASVISANGFTGSVANSTTTPAITLTTSVSGVIKGNGTGMSAATSGADYSAGTSALATGIIKSTTTTGALSIATAGTDYLVPAGSAAISTSSGSGITASAGAITSGLSGANAGSLVLMNSAGGGSFTINPASLGAAQTWTLPSAAPAVGNYLMSTNATGTLAWGSPAANSLPLLGGTMSGAIAMGGNNITGGGTITGTTISGTSFASSIVTGTAPFTVASTTNVANLNASSLNGATFAAPGAIGGTTASTGTFSNLTIAPTVISATGTAAQTTTVITGTGTTFTIGMIGNQILYSNGQSAVITGFASTTSVTAYPSQTVPAGQSFLIIAAGNLNVVPQYFIGSAAQTTTALAGIGTTFTAAMVGSLVIYANGAKATITGFTSATSLTVSPSQTVTSQTYAIFAPATSSVAKITTQVITGSGTYIPTSAGLKYAIIEIAGPGAGGVTGTAVGGAGGGGGAGGYLRVVCPAWALSGVGVISIGPAGAAGAAPASSTTMTVNGGSLTGTLGAIGSVGAASISKAGGLGGVPTATGNCSTLALVNGEVGGSGYAAAANGMNIGGSGGNTFFGPGGIGGVAGAVGGAAGATAYGAGGGAGSGANLGAAGTAGVVIITEFNAY